MIDLNITNTKLLTSKNLSICLVSDDFLPAMTGVGVYLKLIAPDLVRRGHKVSIITSRRKGEPEIEQWQGVTIYRVFTVKVYGFYQALPSVSKIREIFKVVKPDLVHHHYVGYMMQVVCKVALSLKIKQASTYHFGPEVLTQPLPMRPFRGLIRRLMISYNNRFDMIIAPSQNIAKEISRDGVKSPIRFITNPVVFGENSKVKSAERTSGFTILYAGRLGYEKNIAFLIKSFAQLLKKTPDAILWIAGRGQEQMALENLCAQLKISESVKFLGFLDHPTLAKYYSACDTFVLPSLQEVQPLVVMEAMWFSKPVIVTNAIAAAEEMVDHGVNGYIVDPNSKEDLANYLFTLAKQPELRVKQGEASRKRSESYHPELVINEMEDVYCNLIRANPKSLVHKESHFAIATGELIQNSN